MCVCGGGKEFTQINRRTGTATCSSVRATVEESRALCFFVLFVALLPTYVMNAVPASPLRPPPLSLPHCYDIVFFFSSLLFSSVLFCSSFSACVFSLKKKRRKESSSSSCFFFSVLLPLLSFRLVVHRPTLSFARSIFFVFV